MNFRPGKPQWIVCACAALCVAAASPGADAPLPKDLPAYGAEKSWLAPRVEKKTLDNGLTVWILPRDGVPRVDYVLAFQDAGFARDDPQHPGFAGHLARLLSEGSAQYDSRAIAENAQGYGGAISGAAAADGIIVTAHALASKAGPMSQLLAGIVRRPSFPAAEIRLATANALQRLRADEGQAAFGAQREILRIVYGDHPYARTQPTAASIAALTPELLQAEHARRFRPDRALLVIAGPIAPALGFRFAEDAFGDWRGQSGPPAAPVSPPPQLDQAGRVLMQRLGSVQATLVMGQPAVSAGHADHIPLLVAATVVGGGWSGRLMRNLRQDKGYTYGAGASYLFHRAGGAVIGSAAVRNEVSGAALREFMSEYRRLGHEPAAAEELTLTKRYIAGNHLIRHQTQGALAATLASHWLVGLPPEYLSELAERVRHVSAAQVMAMGKKYFDPANQSIVVVGDEAAIVGQLRSYGSFTSCGSSTGAEQKQKSDPGCSPRRAQQ